MNAPLSSRSRLWKVACARSKSRTTASRRAATARARSDRPCADTDTHRKSSHVYTGPQRADHYRCVCEEEESDLMKADRLSAASLPVQPSPFPVSPGTASCVPNISSYCSYSLIWDLF